MADGNSSLQDDELYLPRTVVNKLIKEIVPNIRVSTDARDLLLNCCTEFIHLLASEASDISEKQMKKVISPEHVVEALTTLGFQEYVTDVKAVHKEYKEQASKHRKRGKSKLDRLGIPEEELARQQQQLFDEARQQQLESEMNQQRQIQSMQQQQQQQESQKQPQQSAGSTTQSVSAAATQTASHAVTSVPPTVAPAPLTSVTQTPAAPIPVATATQIPAVTAVQSVPVGQPIASNNPTAQQQQQLQQQRSLPGAGIPPSAAITAASLQATSNLLQQALAMASAQVASAHIDASQQSLLQQSAALQAALAAQRLSPAQSQQLQLLLQAQRQAVAPAADASLPTVPSNPAATQNPNIGPAAISQELSVAQMMMTLAQAAGRSSSSAPAITKPNN